MENKHIILLNWHRIDKEQFSPKIISLKLILIHYKSQMQRILSPEKFVNSIAIVAVEQL